MKFGCTVKNLITLEMPLHIQTDDQALQLTQIIEHLPPHTFY